MAEWQSNHRPPTQTGPPPPPLELAALREEGKRLRHQISEDLRLQEHNEVALFNRLRQQIDDAAREAKSQRDSKHHELDLALNALALQIARLERELRQ